MASQWQLSRLPPVIFLFRKAKSIRLRNLNNASLYDIGRFFVSELSNANLLERADVVTFNFIQAIPPTLLFLFSLIPYLPLGNTETTILKTLKLVTPNDKTYNTIQSFLTDFMHKQHHNVLSFGVLLTLWYASNGMMAVMKSFDSSLSLYQERKWFQRRWTAIKLTLMLMLVLLVTIAVLIIQSKDINKLLLMVFHSVVAVRVLSYIILIALVFVTHSLIYTYGPSLRHKSKFISVGSVFATVVSLLGTALFFFLVNNFLNYNKVYGSIGSFIAFIAWLWYNTVILLVGYQLNVSILLGKLAQGENGAG